MPEPSAGLVHISLGAALCLGLAVPILAVDMKLPDLYGDWRVIVGVVLLLLGAGNWMVGLNGIVQYRQLVTVASDPGAELYGSFDELDSRTDGAVLAPLTQADRTVSYAAAQMDFYHAVYLTGCIIFALGVMVSLMAVIGAIRRDARRSIRRNLRLDSRQPYGQTLGIADTRQNQPLPAHHGTPS